MKSLDQIVSIVREHPGLDAIQLHSAAGLTPRDGTTLKDAEKLGLIEYRRGGWYVKESKAKCQSDDCERGHCATCGCHLPIYNNPPVNCDQCS